MRRYTSFVLISIILFTILIFLRPTPAYAAPLSQSALCGNGSAPDYGFSYDFLQPHWTVGNGLISEQAMIEVDVILDKLNADNIAQTMILVIPADQVGIPTNCVTHFLRYMQLGQPEGPHKDNGFAFVFVVSQDKIDVHYAVGLGLPALVASKLTPINRLGEATFGETKSLDQALLKVVTEFDAYARTVYQSDPATDQQPTDGASVQASGASVLALTCLCLTLLFLIFLLVLLGGGGNGGGGSRSFGGSRPSTGGFSSNNSGSNNRSASTTRGGSGSGRSGRTN